MFPHAVAKLVLTENVPPVSKHSDSTEDHGDELSIANQYQHCPPAFVQLLRPALLISNFKPQKDKMRETQLKGNSKEIQHQNKKTETSQEKATQKHNTVILFQILFKVKQGIQGFPTTNCD